MISPLCRQLSVVALLGLFFVGTRLDAKRVYVDDTDLNKINYSGPDWKSGETCDICYAQPDPSKIHNGTWHDVQARGNDKFYFTFIFTGTSVELGYIAVDFLTTDFPNHTDVLYSIDNVQQWTATSGDKQFNLTNFAFNQTLFNVSGLTNDRHVLRVEMLPPTFMMFDYLVYEDGGQGESTVTPSPTASVPITSSTSGHTKSSTKLGPTVGGRALLVLAIIAVL